MAYGAHLAVLFAQPFRIEPGAVRIEAAACDRGMAFQAVVLGVTPDAGFKASTRGAPVAGYKEWPGIVISRAQATRGDDTGLLVTGRAKAALVVAIAARRFARVGGSGMAGEKTVGVISGSTGRGRAVAVKAVTADVATRAALTVGRGERAVTVPEVRAVRGRRAVGDRRRGSRIGRERGDRPRMRTACLTLITKLLRMTGRAIRRHRAARDGPMSFSSGPARIGM